MVCNLETKWGTKAAARLLAHVQMGASCPVPRVLIHGPPPRICLRLFLAWPVNMGGGGVGWGWGWGFSLFVLRIRHLRTLVDALLMQKRGA